MLKQFLKDRWPTVRDNAFWEAVKLVGILVGLPLGNRIVNYVLSVATALAPEDVRLVSTICTLLVVTAVAVTWAVSRQYRPAIQPATAPALTSAPHLAVPPLPSLPALGLSEDPRAKRLSSNEWLIEVHEVLYRQRVGNLLAVNGWYILVRLSLTNKVSDEPTANYWRLDVTPGTSASLTARTADLPPNWYIEREGAYLVGPSRVEEIERPTLDKVLARDGLLKGKTRSGWVLFEMDTPRRSAGPHNTVMTFLIHDALGVVHRHEERAQLYDAKGEIKIANARQEPPAS